MFAAALDLQSWLGKFIISNFVKVTHIKECIDALYQSQNFSQLQVLAIVSEIRKLVSCDELRVKEIIE